jgi:hypothetical protein
MAIFLGKAAKSLKEHFELVTQNVTTKCVSLLHILRDLEDRQEMFNVLK